MLSPEKSSGQPSSMADASQTGDGVVQNPWRRLREFTDARIGLGRAGVSIPTEKLLEFQLAHAKARDAVHLPLDMPQLLASLMRLSGFDQAAVAQLQSQAPDRQVYLQRPDLGRALNDASVHRLSEVAERSPGCDLALVIVDGLSSRAVQQNAAPFLQALLSELNGDTSRPWQLGPLCVVEQGRVATGDEVGALLGADAVLVMVGERPGLSSPDSLGLYLTWAPRKGLNDAARNCISNVRPAGLAYTEAAQRAMYLLQEARRLRLSGVRLKDRSESRVIEHDDKIDNFLTN